MMQTKMLHRLPEPFQMKIHTCKLVAFQRNSPFWIKICHLCELSRSEDPFCGVGGQREREREKLQVRRQECVRPFLGSTWSITTQTDHFLTSKHHERDREQMAPHVFESLLWYFDVKRQSSARCCFKSNSPHLMSWASEPVHFYGTHGMEVLHCEWSRHKVHNL